MKLVSLKSGTPQYEVVVSVVMVNPTAILWAHMVTGLGTIKHFDNGKYNPKWSAFYQWQVSTRDAAKLLEPLLPYLQIKRRQAELLIELTSLKRQSTTRQQHAPERQGAIVHEMRTLNFRGRRAAQVA